VSEYTRKLNTKYKP